MPLDLRALRELTDRVEAAAFVVDAEGTLVYFNQAASEILGRKLEDIEDLAAFPWETVFLPADPSGMPLLQDSLPLVVALREKRPAHGRLSIRALDRTIRYLEATALPLLEADGTIAGAVAFFWQVRDA